MYMTLECFGNISLREGWAYFAAPLTSIFKLHFQPLQRFSEPLSGRWQALLPNFPACLVAGLALFAKLTVKLLCSACTPCFTLTLRFTCVLYLQVFHYTNIEYSFKNNFWCMTIIWRLWMKPPTNSQTVSYNNNSNNMSVIKLTYYNI